MGSGLRELTRSLDVGGDASRVPALHNVDDSQSEIDGALLLMEQMENGHDELRIHPKR